MHLSRLAIESVMHLRQ